MKPKYDPFTCSLEQLEEMVNDIGKPGAYLLE